MNEEKIMKVVAPLRKKYYYIQSSDLVEKISNGETVSILVDDSIEHFSLMKDDGEEFYTISISHKFKVFCSSENYIGYRLD